MTTSMTRASLVIACLLAGTTAACMAELTPAGKQVRIGRLDPQTGCKELGTVYGSGAGGELTSSEEKLRSSQNDIRNRTAARGGNYVAMDTMGSDVNGMTLSGRAYRCDSVPVTGAAPPPPPPATPPPPSPEERLTKLKDLREKNLITQEDYDARRAEILRSL